MKSFCIVLLASQAAATLLRSNSCEAEDLKHRAMFQNRLAGDCEEMCKEVGAYPKGCTCPGFAQPDSTPGVMTWEELLTHMDNLVAWGKESLKGWTSQAASALQKKIVSHAKTVQGSVSASKACMAQDLQHRAQIQNKLASACEDMCKEIGAYPDCECPDFVQPDSTPGVVTWDELLENMDNLVAWSVDLIKSWKGRAAEIQVAASNVTKNATKKLTAHNATNSTKKANRGCSLKGKRPGTTADVTVTTPYNAMAGGSWVFEGPGQVKMTDGTACLNTGGFDGSPTVAATSGGASEKKAVSCGSTCCIQYCCGTTSCFSSR